MSDFYFKKTLLEKLDTLAAAVSALEDKINILIQKEETMSAETDALRAAVEAETTVNQSAITLLNQLGDYLRAHADDPAAITAYADQITQNANDLATAVTTNTPAAPTP